MSFLEIKNICKSFEGKSVLNNINISIKKGAFVSLLGKSGCGKTTLLRTIAGLELPEIGNIHLNGVDITSTPVQSRNIGFVFQNYALFPHLNVWQNIAYGLKIKKLSTSIVNAKVESVLNKVGLAQKKNTNVSLLSGGEQQRVAFARAIVNEPEILLLDEPLSNLDFSLRTQARNELKRLQRETGITSIFVTHDQT
ncbi:MAG: ABC transporter ATP-binding protein, partial [Ferruginibacter sp.]|nr:ABC transporter ATP-binding protein [Ferruginibacter sp.]